MVWANIDEKMAALTYQVVWGPSAERGESSRTPRLRRVPSQTKEDSWFQKPFRAKHATGRFNSAGKAAENTLAPPKFRISISRCTVRVIPNWIR